MQYEIHSHQYWMRRAIELAKLNQANKSGLKCDTPIAALIVKDDRLIAKAVNMIEVCNDATCHAEMLVIRGASQIIGNWRLSGCTLYSTLEPCVMCSGAILNSRISSVVFGAYDFKCGACGSVVDLFSDLKRESQVEVIGGILELEASKLLKDFFSLQRSYKVNSPNVLI